MTNTESAPTLKSCPWCGGLAELEATGYEAEVAHQTFERIDVWVCGCVECGIRGPSSTASEDDAIASWNRRSGDRDATIEECAKVADGYASRWRTGAKLHAAQTIAANIRALRRAGETP